MVVVQNSSGPSILSSGITTNEVIKYVRNNINQTIYQYQPEKIKSRSKRVFLTHKDEDYWKKTLDRRDDQKSRGFFARPDRKYKECGDVELQTKQLLINSLENIGNRFVDQKHTAKKSVSLDFRDTQTSIPAQGGVLSKQDKKRHFIQKESDNGISTIKKLLEQADRRITSVRAGQSLSAYLHKEKDEKKRELLEEEESNNNALDMVLIDVSEKRSGGGNMIRLENNTGGEIDEKQRPAECRKKVDFQEKLNNLITIFTITNNMRQKDLRTRVPLTLESLKMLKKHPLVNDQSYQPIVARLQTFDQSQPSTARYGRNSVMLPPGTMLFQTKDAERLHVGAGNRLVLPGFNESVSRHSELASPYQNNQRKLRNVQARHKNSPTSTPCNGIKVETWDELMAIRTGRADSTTLESDHNARAVSRISMHAGPTKFNPHYKKRGGAWQTKGVNEVTPPWLKILQDQRDSNEKDIQCTRQKGNELKSKRHDEILGKLKSGFEETKQTYAKKMKDELDNRVDAYEKQFELLECNHIRETDMKSMRGKINEWRQHVNMSTARPPLWVETLKIEQKHSQCLNDDQSNEKLQDIMKFIETKPSLVIKAKLCLMVFSLPVYELCTVQMKDAIKFFLEEVLEQSDNGFKQWLQARKLT